jgi:hypothetical protein
VFENRMLRRIYGVRRDEVTGGWIKLYNGELHNLYPLVGQESYQDILWMSNKFE